MVAEQFCNELFQKEQSCGEQWDIAVKFWLNNKDGKQLW